MRGYKWKMLTVAMGTREVTSLDFSRAAGIPAPQCSPYARSLEKEGYLRLAREVPLARGGRPMKFYAWTGKYPPREGEAGAGAFEPDSMWGKADLLLNTCFTAMIKCRGGENEMECAV